jgi:hypothetical protein
MIGLGRRSESKSENAKALYDNPPLAQAKISDGKPLSTPTGKATKGHKTIGIGLLLTGATGWVIYQVVQFFSDPSFGTKGRLLRIRNRAQLPEVGQGDGWHDESIHLGRHDLRATERTALAELWLLSARMEQASIAAFAQLSLYLATLGAPARLHRMCQQAALDEIDHAQRCYAIARQLSGKPWTAGPIAALAKTGSEKAMCFRRLAVGSLIDGCLSEGLASKVARAAGASVTDEAIRETLKVIAHDEATHAELAWEVLAWCLAQGGDEVSAVVESRLAGLEAQLTPKLPDIQGISVARLEEFGVLTQDRLEELAREVICETRERAQRLLGSSRSRLAA